MKELKASPLFREKVIALGGYMIVAAISVICNIISETHFPPSHKTISFSAVRFIAFLMNLIAPYELDEIIRIILVLLSTCILFKIKSKITAFFVLSILINAVFWSFLFPLSNATLSPRYLFTASVFFALLAGYFLGTLLSKKGIIQRTAVLCILASFLSLNAYLIRYQDSKWFEYLSGIGQRIHDIAKTDDSKKKIYIDGYCTLDNRNLNFFKDKIIFITDKKQIDEKTYIVSTDKEKYVKYFRKDFGKAYWYFPWFTNEKSLLLKWRRG